MEGSELQCGSKEPLLKTNELLVGKPGQKFRLLLKNGPFGKSNHLVEKKKPFLRRD